MLIVDSDEEGPSDSADGSKDERVRKRKLEETEDADAKRSRLEEAEDSDDVIELD